MKKFIASLVAVSSAALLSSQSALAQDTWNSASGTAWNSAGNWLSGTVPASTDTVVLDKSNVSLPATLTLTTGSTPATISAGSLYIGSSTGEFSGETNGSGPALTGLTLQASGGTTSDTLTLSTGSITMDSSVQGGVAIGSTPTSTGTITLTTGASGFSFTNNSSTQALTIGATIGVASDTKNVALNSSGGAIVLSGANASTGSVTIGSGSNNTYVQVGNASALSSFSAVTVKSGSSLDLNGTALTATNITLNGAGFGTGSTGAALVSNTGTATDAGTITLASNATIKNYAGGVNTALNLTGPIANGAYTLTVDGTGSVTLSGVIGSGSFAGGLTKVNTNTLTINGSAANTYTGATTAGGGLLVEDFANATSSTNLLSSSGSLVLGGFGGGTFQVKQKNNTATSQTFASTTINAGANTITGTVAGSGGLVIALGTISQTTGGTVSFSLPTTGSITTTSSNVSGIVGPWATIGNASYATVSGGSIIALPTASQTTATASNITSATTNYTLGTALTLANTSTGNTLQYTGSAATLANGGNNLTLNGLLNSGSGTLTISGSGNVLAGSTGELVITGSQAVNLASAVTSGALTDSNTGGVILSGTNTYAGATNINAGTMTLNGVLSATSAINVGNSATLTEAATGTISGTLPITIGNGSTVTLAGANTYTGVTTLGNASTLNINNASALGTGTLVINGGTINNSSAGAIAGQTNNPAQVWNNSFTFTGTQGLDLGTGTVTLNVSPTITVSGNTLTIDGVITGNFGLTKAGNGGLTLTANETYTGLTTVSAGTLTLTGSNSGSGGIKVSGGQLNIGNASALGNGTLTIGGGTIDNTSGGALSTVTTYNNINLSGSFTFVGSNSLDFAPGSLDPVGSIPSGEISLTATPTITVSANTLEFDGVIEPSAFGITKAGTGTLLLAAGGIYSGATTVNAGTLIIEGQNTGSGAYTVNGGTLDVTGGNGGLNGAGEISGNGTITVNNTGTLLVDNRGAGNNNSNHLGNSNPIVMSGGSKFIYEGSDSGNSTEQTGSITLNPGISTITVQSNNGYTAKVTLPNTGAVSITSGGSAGTALINGTGLGDAASGTGILVTTGNPTLVGTTAAGSTGINTGVDNTQIVPYLLGESGTATGQNGTATGTANTFLTYNATSGFRPLNPTDEFVSTPTTGDNTYISSNSSSTGSISINSLVINGGNLGITGTLTNASNALLFVTSNSITGGSYNLGGTATTGTYNAYITTDAGANATIGSSIILTGTNTNVGNLTVYGYAGGSLDLTGSNSYNGSTTVATGATLLIGNNNALGTSYIAGFGGTIAADNQARTIGNLVVNQGINAAAYPLIFGGSNALTFTGANSASYTGTYAGIAFTDAQYYNTPLTISNTAPTTFSGSVTLTNGASGHNNSGNYFNVTSSADLVFSGPIVDNYAGNSTGATNALQVNYSGATANTTFSNSSNNFDQGASYSFTWQATNASAGFYTLTLSGGTPLGNTGLGSNGGDLLLVAQTNGETLNNSFAATGGSIGNYNFGLGFAGSNSMTWNAAVGGMVNFLNIAAPAATLTFNGNSVVGTANWNGYGNYDFGSSETMTGANFSHSGAGTLTISSTDNMTGTTTLNGGTTILDYSTNNNTKLAQNAGGSAGTFLQLEGVNLQLSGGSYAQGLGTPTSGADGTNLFVGQTNISDTNSGTSTIALGPITRSTGGVINFGSATVASTTSLDTNGIMGGWATVNGTDWAVSGATSGTYTITALPSGSYTTWPGGSTGNSANNYVLSAGGPYSTTGNFAANTLKFSTASGTLSLGSASTLNVTSGGLLFTGNNNYGIASGTLTTSASDLVVNQYSANTVSIGSVISGSGALTIAGGGTVALSGANSYTGGTNLDGSEVQITADNNLGGTGTITMQGGTLDVTTAGYSSSRALVLGVDGGTVEVDAGTLTESGVVSGGSNNTPVIFNKTGAGTLVLSGNNTLYAQVNINGGTLMMGVSGTPDNTALGASSATTDRADAALNVNTGTLDINGSTAALGVITLNGGSIIDSATTKGTLTGYSFNLESGTLGAALVDDIISGTTSDPIDLYKYSSGTVVLTGNNSYSGATQISGGILQIGNGGTSGTLGTANVTTNGALPTGVSATAGSGTIAFDRSDNITISNAISGTGGVTQMGTGTLTLGASNSYSGTTAINNGTLLVSALAPLSSSTVQQLGDTSGVTLGVAGTSSGLFYYTGSAATLTASVTALGNGHDTVQNAGAGTLTLAGNLGKNGTTLTLNAGSGGINVTGTITGPSANSDMDFTGGTTTVSTLATYNGPTWIYGSGDVVNNVSGGALPSSTVLNIGTPGANGAATSSSTTAGTFDLDGNNQTVGGLNTSGTGAYTSDIVTNNGGATSTLTVSGGGTFAGVIQNGTSNAALSVSGGTLALSGSNTYSGGTTVSAGTLLASNTTAGGSATGTGSLTVNAGATLGGYGTSSGTGFSISGTGTATGARANVLVGMNSATDTSVATTLTLKGSAAGTISNANLTFNLNSSVAGGLGTNPTNSGTELAVGATPITFGLGTQSTTLSLNFSYGIVGAYTPYVLVAGLTTGGADQYTNLSLGTSTGTLASGLITPILNSNFGGTGNVTLSMSGTAAGYYGGNSYLFLYQNSTTGADDIEVEVVPEPGTWALMLGGLAVLIVWQRRRNKMRP